MEEIVCEELKLVNGVASKRKIDGEESLLHQLKKERPSSVYDGIDDVSQGKMAAGHSDPLDPYGPGQCLFEMVPDKIYTSQGEIAIYSDYKDPDRIWKCDIKITRRGMDGWYDPLDPDKVLDQPWKIAIEAMYREIDASLGTMGRFSDSPWNIPNQKVYSGVDVSQGEMASCSNPLDLAGEDSCETLKMMLSATLATNLRLAKTALEYYEKCQVAEFEIVKVMYSECSRLAKCSGGDTQVWCHVSFIAKAKNRDCSDVSTKCLFAELLQDENTKKFNVMSCTTFEPSNDPGFDHGCALCRPNEKFHPAADGYEVGRHAYYVPEEEWD